MNKKRWYNWKSQTTNDIMSRALICDTATGSQKKINEKQK